MAATVLAMVGLAVMLGLLGAVAVILRKLNMDGAAAVLLGFFAAAVCVCAAGLSIF